MTINVNCRLNIYFTVCWITEKSRKYLFNTLRKNWHFCLGWTQIGSDLVYKIKMGGFLKNTLSSKMETSTLDVQKFKDEDLHWKKNIQEALSCHLSKEMCCTVEWGPSWLISLIKFHVITPTWQSTCPNYTRNIYLRCPVLFNN